MSEIAVPDDGSTPLPSSKFNTSTSSEGADTQDSAAATFWDSFHIFSSKFEEFCIRRWYLFLIAFYVVLLILNVLEDMDYGFLASGHLLYYFSDRTIFTSSDTFGFLTSWGYNFFVVGLFLTLPVFYNWQKGIPDLFQTLERKHLLTNPDQGTADVHAKYQKFLDEYQQALIHSGKKRNGKTRILTRPIFTGGALLLAAIFITIFWIIDVGWLRQISSEYNLFLAIMFGMENVVRETLYILLLVYLTIGIFWTILVTGLYLRKLTTQFELIIVPGHPDGCGGFKFLGDFALRMALIILMLCTFFAFYTIWRGFSIWSIGTSIILMFLLSLAYFAFFAPLWTIHLKMLKVKSIYEDAYAHTYAKVEEETRKALEEGDLDKVKVAKEEGEMVQALHPDKISFPTWPFNRRVLLTFVTPQIVPIITLFAGLSQPAADALKAFLTILSGGHS